LIYQSNRGAGRTDLVSLQILKDAILATDRVGEIRILTGKSLGVSYKAIALETTEIKFNRLTANASPHEESSILFVPHLWWHDDIKRI
jgi:hypothetical protein